jgi:hypothetical protein
VTTHQPGTDDDYEWQSDDLFDGAKQSTLKTSAPNEIKDDKSTDTVLDKDEEDPSFDTILSDDPIQIDPSPSSQSTNSTTRHVSEAPAIAPHNDSKYPQRLTMSTETTAASKPSTQGHTDRQILSKQTILSNSLAPSLKTPKEQPWNVVSSPGKRKANEVPFQPGQITLRKSTTRSQTPKKLFQPAIPHEEAPAPKK